MPVMQPDAPETVSYTDPDTSGFLFNLGYSIWKILD